MRNGGNAFSLNSSIRSLDVSVGLCIRSHRDSIFAGGCMVWREKGRGRGRGEGKPVSAHDFWRTFFRERLGMWSSVPGRYQHRQSGHARALLVGLARQGNSNGLESQSESVVTIYLFMRLFLAVPTTPVTESLMLTLTATGLAYASCRLIHKSVDYSRHTSHGVRLQSCILFVAQLLKEADKAVLDPTGRSMTSHNPSNDH